MYHMPSIVHNSLLVMFGKYVGYLAKTCYSALCIILSTVLNTFHQICLQVSCKQLR